MVYYSLQSILATRLIVGLKHALTQVPTQYLDSFSETTGPFPPESVMISSSALGHPVYQLQSIDKLEVINITVYRDHGYEQGFVEEAIELRDISSLKDR